MCPVQEITIRTKKNRLFHVNLNKLASQVFEIELAEMLTEAQPLANSTFKKFTSGTTAEESFKNLIDKFIKYLANTDKSDAISIINNPCNTEFINADDQQKILGDQVEVQVNK